MNRFGLEDALTVKRLVSSLAYGNKISHVLAAYGVAADDFRGVTTKDSRIEY